MHSRDDGAVLGLEPDPVGVLVLRAQRTRQGLRVRLTSTFDVERSPQGTSRLFDEVEPALTDVARWLSTFTAESERGSDPQRGNGDGIEGDG
jgi:hypothetical protein